MHRWPQSVPILYNWRPFPPSKLPLPMAGSGPPSNTWFPLPTRVLQPNGISIGSTDLATRSVVVLRCGLIIMAVTTMLMVLPWWRRHSESSLGTRHTLLITSRVVCFTVSQPILFGMHLVIAAVVESESDILTCDEKCARGEKRLWTAVLV